MRVLLVYNHLIRLCSFSASSSLGREASDPYSNSINMSQFFIDNSLLIVVIAVSVLGLLIPIVNTRRYAPEVSPAQATELINHHGAQLVDVRKAADFAKGHIANSRNIPADQIQNEFGKLKRERPVILVDQTGVGSRPVARLLRGVGFQQVTILERGIVGWLQAKMPLE